MQEPPAATPHAIAWEDLLDQACTAADVRAAALVLRQSPRTVLEPDLVTRHATASYTWPEGGTTAVALAAQLVPDEILLVADIRRDPRFAALRRQTPLRFLARVPLATREGAPLGALYLLDTTPRELTPAQMLALRTVTGRLVRQVALRREMADVYLSSLRREDRALVALVEQARQDAAELAALANSANPATTPLSA